MTVKANSDVRGDGHAYVEIKGAYGPIGTLTRLEAEALIRDLRQAANEAHNRGTKDITKDRL